MATGDTAAAPAPAQTGTAPASRGRKAKTPEPQPEPIGTAAVRPHLLVWPDAVVRAQHALAEVETRIEHAVDGANVEPLIRRRRQLATKLERLKLEALGTASPVDPLSSIASSLAEI